MARQTYIILGLAGLYFIVFVCGFCVVIPIGLTKNESGVCSLYIKSEQSNRTHLQLGPSSVCNYLIAFGTIGMLVYGFGLIMYCIWLAVMSARHQRTNINVRVFIIMTGVVLVLSLISSCLISAGLQKTCKALVATSPGSKCKDLQDSKEKPLGSFYTNYRIAEAASWIGLLTEVGIIWLYLMLLFEIRRSERRVAALIIRQ